MKFIDVLDSRYPLREEDNEQITIIITAGAPVILDLIICGKHIKKRLVLLLSRTYLMQQYTFKNDINPTVDFHSQQTLIYEYDLET